MYLMMMNNDNHQHNAVMSHGIKWAYTPLPRMMKNQRKCPRDIVIDISWAISNLFSFILV